MNILLLLSSAAALLMIGVGLIVALLPARILDLAGSMQEVGLLASVFAISYLLAQMPVGYLADRIGAKPLLVFGYLVTAVSGIVFYLATSTEMIYVGRFIQGLGEAPIWALGPALLSQAYPRAKGRAIGIYNAAVHFGLSLGPLLGIFWFSQQSGGQPFLLFAALSIFGGMLLWRFLPRTTLATREIAQVPSVRDLLKLLSRRTPAVTLAGVVIYGAGYGICISVLPATLAVDMDFDVVSNGIYFVLFYLAISVSQLIVGPLSDRYGRQVFMAAGLLMAAVGFFSFTHFSQPLIFVPLTLASFGLGVFCVSSLAYLNECVPAALRSTVSACYYLAWGLGYFLGPLLAGQLGGGFVWVALLMSIEVGAIYAVMRD